MGTSQPEGGAVVIRDDSEVESILASIGPGPSVSVLSLEGDTYDVQVGDIVQVLSNSGGFQGVLAYVLAFTDTGRITVVMPANQEIRSYKAKNIRYLCREEDDFGVKFHQQHNTRRWQRLMLDQEQESDSQSENSHVGSQEITENSLAGSPHVAGPLQGPIVGVVNSPVMGHWIFAIVETVCVIM